MAGGQTFEELVDLPPLSLDVGDAASLVDSGDGDVDDLSSVRVGILEEIKILALEIVLDPLPLFELSGVPLDSLAFVRPVLLFPNQETFELHDVSCQGPCLV